MQVNSAHSCRKKAAKNKPKSLSLDLRRGAISKRARVDCVEHAVSFVSVTLQLNRNTPLERLTLNILLSFARASCLLRHFAGHRLSIACICAGDPLLTCLCSSTERMNVVAGESMNSHSHILFNKTPEQLRRLGARGGRVHARNQRAQRALLAELPQPVTAPVVPAETAAEAIAVLDVQFPWLRRAERRVSRNQLRR
jgi:hypothetical protein